MTFLDSRKGGVANGGKPLAFAFLPLVKEEKGIPSGETQEKKREETTNRKEGKRETIFCKQKTFFFPPRLFFFFLSSKPYSTFSLSPLTLFLFYRLVLTFIFVR